MPRNKPLVYRRAQRDIRKAYAWYHRRNPRAATNFLFQVDEAIAAIGANPYGYPKWKLDYRFRTLDQYPYVVYFRIAGDYVIIATVIHERRKPGRWLK